MKSFTARSRIAFGLACLLLSVLCTAMMMGIVPERKTALLAGRAQLCELIAIYSSDFISRGEIRRLEHLIESAVERNDQLLSIGVRRIDGTLIKEVGNHAAAWISQDAEHSNETQVHVPIRAGKDRWGSIELRFRPSTKDGFWGYWENPWVSMALFVTGCCYILFFIYLGKMLQHLDPSKTVPKRVRAALDSLAEGLLVIDRDQRIVLANQAISDWIGRTPEQLIGTHAAKLGWVKNEQGERLETYPWIEAIQREAPQAGVMLCLERADKPTRVLMANASPVLGQDGKYRGVLVSFDDVTQLEETRRDLDIAKRAAEDSQRAAENANQAKSEFLAHMSHEIRTPMNAILGYTDVLRRGFDDSIEDRQDYLNTIHDSGEHLLALINDILDLSKIESGRMELELDRCAPHQLISQVVALLRSKAEEKGISLEFHCAGPLPESILADAVRLRQTVMNLVGNAIKFTEQGGVKISARMIPHAHSSSHNSLLAIDVIDSGIGIADDAQDSIFEPFAQADTSITRRFGGTGLGLAISKQLAEAMGGGISLQSTRDQGSIFTLTIDPGPLQGVQLIDFETAQAKLARNEPTRADVVQLPFARILIADDGESNRKLLRVVLSRAGVEVVTVENGQQAVEQALRNSFDIILMDMQMPVLDGYSATTLLRKSEYTRPIIALTAHAMHGDEEKCRHAGCSGFMTKPINIDRLLSTLAELLTDRGCQLRDATQRSPANVNNPTASRIDDGGEHASENETCPAELSEIHCSYPMDDLDFLEIAQEFVVRLDEKLTAMRNAWSTRNLDELAALAHWLKGSGGTAGFDAFSVPATALELMARRKNLELIPATLDKLQRLADRIVVPTPS